ncbi:MAG: hypothetical protein P8Y85_05810 [Nitrospirota bacterium]|jgi:hypothetical protein
MNSRLLAVAVVALILFFMVGFRVSYSSGIQPGYFEKQEAPAYGVGGGEGLGAGLSEDVEKFYQQLYEEEQ